MLRKKFFSTLPLPPSGPSYYQATTRGATGAPASVTGYQFSPALVISRARSLPRPVALFSVSTGPLKRMNTTDTTALTTDTNTLTSFDSQGFSVGADTPQVINAGATDYTTWSFASKPGFFASTTYTGTGTDNLSVAHGLGVVPELVILKCMTTAGRPWPVYAGLVAGDLYLNRSNTLTPLSTAIDVLDRQDITTASPRRANAIAVGGTTIVCARGDELTVNVIYGSGTSFAVVATPAAFTSIAYSPTLNLFVASSASPAGVYYSADGNTWLAGTTSGYVGQNITWCNDAFLSIEGQDVFKSTDGMTWTKYANVMPTTSGYGAWSNPCFGNGLYVAVTAGNGGADPSTPSKCGVAYSSDGLTWTLGDAEGTVKGQSTFMTRLVFGNGVFVVSGPGGFVQRADSSINSDVVNTNAAQVYRSVDGNIWTATAVAFAANWENLRFGDGQFLVVSANLWGAASAFPSTDPAPNVATNQVLVSTNGFAWATSSVPTSAFWGSVEYSAALQRFVAFSTGDLIYGVHAVTQSTQVRNPTATTLTIGVNITVNVAANQYLALLFASVPGISLVGSFIGNGTTQNVECGFVPRFILVRRINLPGNWAVWDSTRDLGPIANGPYALLNDVGVELPSTAMHTTGSGFRIDVSDVTNVNATGSIYLFFAVA